MAAPATTSDTPTDATKYGTCAPAPEMWLYCTADPTMNLSSGTPCLSLKVTQQHYQILQVPRNTPVSLSAILLSATLL